MLKGNSYRITSQICFGKRQCTYIYPLCVVLFGIYSC